MKETTKTTTKQTDMRTNTLVPVSFGQHETPLDPVERRLPPQMYFKVMGKTEDTEEFGDENLQGVS